MFYSRHISYLTILIVFSVNDDAACQGFSDWNAFNYVYIEHTPLDGAHSADNWNHVALTYQFLAQESDLQTIPSRMALQGHLSKSTSKDVLCILISTSEGRGGFGGVEHRAKWEFTMAEEFLRSRNTGSAPLLVGVENHVHENPFPNVSHNRLQSKWERSQKRALRNFTYDPELNSFLLSSFSELVRNSSSAPTTDASYQTRPSNEARPQSTPIRFRQSQESDAIQSVAVLPMESLDCSKNMSSATDESLLVEQELLGLYTVVDRGHLDMILAEQRLAMTGLIMEEGALAKAGCLAGAQGTTIVTRGCLLDNDILTIKMIDCSTSVTYWVASGPTNRVYDIMDEIRSQLR